MKKLLLDTHVLIWFIEGNSKLSRSFIELMNDSNNQKYICSISFFEIAIKERIGKLKLTNSIQEYYDFVNSFDITIVPIQPSHLTHYLQLPLYDNHKDPFDRLLLATAKAEKYIVVTDDKKFEQYKSFVEIIVGS